MDTFFGKKKKERPRQSSVSTNASDERLVSVPYHKLGPPSKSPVTVNTVSQGLRANPGAIISAPMTNPSLTTKGTDLNVNRIMRQRSERDRAYRDATGNTAYPRPNSPSTSISTADSSTLYNDSEGSSKANARRVRQSESGSSLNDFGIPPTSPSPRQRALMAGESLATVRPSSSVTTTTSRASNYTSSLTSPDSHHRHLSITSHLARLIPEEFNFPRPTNDEEIEVLFENVWRERQLGEQPSLSLEQKWNMVLSNERMLWEESKKKEEQARKQLESGQAVQIIQQETPEWYIKKFMDKTITAKQAGALQVSLRSNKVEWFKNFVELQGTPVLAQTLAQISLKALQRRKEDIDVEYEVTKCLKYIFNHQFAARDALSHPQIISQIASSLNTPNLSTRKILLEILVFWGYWSNASALPLVVQGLEKLSNDNHEHSGCYAFWFKSFEQALIGRGKMGTLVGASEEVKKHGASDPTLNDYTQANIILVNTILDGLDDIDLRVHHRSMMQSAGLERIMKLCRSFGVSSIDSQLDILEQSLEEDEKKLRERVDQDILKDLANPEDVYNALTSKTADSKARDYFLSMMQHLLLIREEGPGLVHTFQLIDSMVTDLVMDKKLGGAEQRLGHSVERIIAQFNEADRYQQVEDELAKANAALLHLKLEKEGLEDEISQGGNGLVGVLKGKVAHLEDKLQISRENTTRLQGQLEAQKSGYEEQISQLETQIMELFRMLKEVGKGVDKIMENSGGMDRKTLIETLEKHLQRDKTIGILEGRAQNLNREERKRKTNGKSIMEDDDSGEGSGDDDATPKKSVPEVFVALLDGKSGVLWASMLNLLLERMVYYHLQSMTLEN
ncbi:hypothetical protein EUX98_g4591 [Antrodiella citrinella]|uniref:GBD/FH3 domain-containing protein n=1 Tax=Antrodiella citrinella TaxID=2447956 RepID=A0A4S4MWD8_9APHY|nr:hypothetical protein EUX98_g4591 [Antrodiella citrinella]